MADKTIFELAVGAALALTDYVITGQDPSGTPVMRKQTFTTVRNLLVGEPTAAGDFIVSNGSAWQKKTLAQTQVALHPYNLISGVYHKQIWIAGFTPTVTNGSADSALIEMGTNKNVYSYLAFDPTAIEYAFANVPMPDDYTGGALYYKVWWLHPAATAYKVRWGLQGVAISNDDTLDVAQGDAIYVDDEGATTSDLYVSPLSGALTIAGTPVAGDLVQFRISRKADDADNDTLDVDAYLIGAMVWYPVR